jgi:hypothetical protein
MALECPPRRSEKKFEAIFHPKHLIFFLFEYLKFLVIKKAGSVFRCGSRLNESGSATLGLFSSG